MGNSKRVTILTSALVAGLLLTSCGGDESAEVPAAASVASTPAKVTNKGTAPLETIAWANDSSDQSVAFEATQGLEQSTEGGTEDTKLQDLPYEEVTMNLPLSTAVEADGDGRTTTVTVGTPTGTNNERNDDIASATGFVMTTKQSADGQATERTMQAPDSASDSARASVESALNQINDFPVVFPTEPIGVGATWTVSNQVDAGVSMFQDITYTLKERKGNNVTLSVSVDRRPAVTSYGQTELQVMDSKTQSSGELKIDLTKAVPQSGSLEATTSLTLGEKDSDVRVIQKTTARGQWS